MGTARHHDDQELRALHEHAIVSKTDRSGRIIEVNERFVEISGYSARELIGQNHRILKSGQHSEAFYQELWNTIRGGEVWRGEICNRARDGSLYWVSSTIVPYLDESGEPYQYIAVRKDITHLKRSEALIRQQVALADRQARLLNMLHESLTTFVLEGRFQITLERMLDSLMALTGSEFGFLTEVLRESTGSPCLRVHAIRDSNAGVGLPEDSVPPEFCDLDNLLGVCLRERKPVVVDQPSERQPFGRLPLPHPTIHTLLSVPVFVGPELVGTFALANRQTGYDDALIDFLRPFTATYGVIIHSQRMLETEAVNRTRLVQAKHRADQANRAKTEFLSSMSHELRTPLNAILGFGQLLESDAALNDEQQDNVHEILNASAHLLTLIDEVLDLAKIESGRLDLSLEVISVPELLEETRTLIRHSAESMGITLCIGDTGDLRVTADWTRLKQALLNLMSNAVKYNREHGEVRVWARRQDDGWVDILVSDTGAGIAPERIPELFQPFNRLGAELKQIEGTGIGLALTKRLVALMGGSIGVESQVGKGSTFWLRLPCGERSRPASDAAPAPLPEADADAETGVDASDHCILYIEDNPVNRKLISRILQRYPRTRLLTAATGAEGLALARAESPDVILLDINLPDTDGYRILQTLRNDPVTRATPVIALTANAMHNQVRRGRQAGFDEYLTKPIGVEPLLGAVDKYLGHP